MNEIARMPLQAPKNSEGLPQHPPQQCCSLHNQERVATQIPRKETCDASTQGDYMGWLYVCLDSEFKRALVCWSGLNATCLFKVDVTAHAKGKGSGPSAPREMSASIKISSIHHKSLTELKPLGACAARIGNMAFP